MINIQFFAKQTNALYMEVLFMKGPNFSSNSKNHL